MALSLSPKHSSPPLDLEVLDNGMVFADREDCLEYLWFRLVEREAGREYPLHRAVRLKMLRYLPQETRLDAGLLDTMRTALTGMYNQRLADYDPCMLVAGIFDPPLGVIQCYGAVGLGAEIDQAVRNATLGMGAIEGVMANFPQSRLESLNIEKADWLRRAFLEMNHSLVVIGQPDPRQNARGMGREGPGEAWTKGITTTGESAYTMQQNEMLFRALARLQEEFLFLVLASRLAQGDLATMLEGIAAEASVPASRQTGAKAITFGLSFPLMASGGLGQGSGTSQARSEGQSTADSVGKSDVTSHVEGHATTVGQAVTDGWAHTEGSASTSGGSVSHSVSVVEGTSHATGASQGTADSAGSAHTVGAADTVGSAHTVGHATSSGGSSSVTTSASQVPEVVSTTSGASTQQGTAQQDSTNWGASTQEGAAHQESSNWNAGAQQGTSQQQGSNWSAGTEQGASQQQGANWSAGTQQGTAHTDSSNVTVGANASLSLNENVSGGVNVQPEVAGTQLGSLSGGASLGSTQTVGGSVSGSVGQADTASQGASSSVGGSASETASHGTSASVGGSASETASQGISTGMGGGQADTASQGVSASVGGGQGTTVSQGASASTGVTVTPAHTIVSTGVSSSSFSSSTDSVADTTSQAHTDSVADTTSQAHTDSQGTSQADGVSRSVATTDGYSSFASTTHSVADTTSHAETRSWANTDSVADGQAHGVSVGHASGRTSAMSIGRATSIARMMGMGAGVVPAVSASKSYQWWDDKAVQLTQILRAQEELLRQATLEGAYLTDAYVLCRTERGAAAAEAAVRQAFHGSQLPVVTPVQTRRLTPAEQAYIRLHAMCFAQSTREETVAGALEAYKDSTLLLPLQLAAYVAPGLFEEGPAVTTQERIPAFAFVPDMPGEVVLAHLYSTETGRLTPAQLRLSQERMFHFAFAGDTGYGKTVAAERLALETTKFWKYRTVVLDFGAGWRRMLNAPLGEAGRVEVLQVFAGAAVPFRWNPLQIGRRVNPERQMTATCELIRNAGRMGPRQLGYMRRALKELYIQNGVLTSYREVLSDDRWSVVQSDEWEALDAARAEHGLAARPRERFLHLADLEAFERQALAVHRSKAVDLTAWYHALKSTHDALPASAAQDRTSLLGVLLRVESFAEGEMERMYGRGEGSLAIEDLGALGPAADPWGISILEGGAEMDEFAKAMIFSLIAWHLYNDAVVRRRLSIGREPQRKLQIFFEEANKVLSGVATEVGDNDALGGNQTSEQWLTMWRDGRKYGIWLHAIAQTVSELPPGILSSCNNAFFSQTKNPRDRDLEMAHLAFSEKGFTDEDYKRFISRMAKAMAICKLGYSEDVMHTTPFLCRPVQVPALEPTDVELLEYHLAMQTARRRNGNRSG